MSQEPVWLAWWAITEGDEPIERVGEYVKLAVAQLSEMTKSHPTELSTEDQTLLADLLLFLVGLRESLPDGDERCAMQMVFKRKRAGKPPRSRSRARQEHVAAGAAEKLIQQGEKVEAAVQIANEQTGISRAEIFARMKHRQYWLSRANKTDV